MSDSAQSLRREIEEFDPFAQPLNAIASLTLEEETDTEGDEDEARPSYSRFRHAGKGRRAPSRDLSDALKRYAAHAIDEHAAEIGNYHGEPRFEVDDSHLIEWANVLNTKYLGALNLWRQYRREKKAGAIERRSAENELAVYRALQPLRHLIAIADEPHRVDDGEIEGALDQLSAIAEPELLKLATDVALMVDLTAQIRELSAKTLPALFEIYKRHVDQHPMLRSYVVNWCRDGKQAGNESIYPPTAIDDESEDA